MGKKLTEAEQIAKLQEKIKGLNAFVKELQAQNLNLKYQIEVREQEEDNTIEGRLHRLECKVRDIDYRVEDLENSKFME